MKKLLLSTLIFAGFCSNSIAQNGLNFDGPSDILLTNYDGVLGSTNRTFEAWVFVSSSAPNSNLCILDYGTNAVGSRNTFAVSASRQLSFTSGGTNANISSPASSVPIDQWAHVAFVLNNGTGYLYVDGTQVGTGSLTTVNTPSSQDVRVGQRVSGGSIPFHGTMDEVRIWSTARTLSEIQATMNGELCSQDANLELYFRFNQGIAGGSNPTEVNATDDSGNNHISTLTSFALTGAASNWTLGATLTAGFSTASFSETECNSYLWPADAMTYTSSGIYSAVLSGANMNGCDSIVSLDLTINTSNDLSTDVMDCDSYLWSINGQTYLTSTTVVESQTTSEGCPYDHTLNLVLGQSTSDTTEITSCDEYTWASNGQVYNTSGVYSEMMTSITGCDSIVTLDLTINTVDASVTNNLDLTITADEVNATYQWLDCDNAYAIIGGATSQTYLAPGNGNYAVEVNSNGCTDTSTCVTIDFAGVENVDQFGAITLSPNPTTSSATLTFANKITDGKAIIIDAQGRVLQSYPISNTKETLIEINSDAGIYFVQIWNGARQTRTIRLVKE